LLALFVNLMVISNYTPDGTAVLPIIGIYYSFNIVQVALSVAASVCVLRFHFRGHKKERLPDYIKKLLLMNILNSDQILKLEDTRTQYEKYKDEEDQLIFHISSNLKKSHSITMNKRNNWNLDTTDLLNQNIMSVKKLVEKTNKLIKKEKKITNQHLINLIEWKEAARRIDNILLVVSIIIVTLVPAYLFSGYAFSNIILTFSEKCSCSV
jgi:hypothetical protein